MQEFIHTLLQSSISMSLVTLLYATILPILSKRYTAKWCYLGWILIVVGWVFPFRPQIDFLSIPMLMSDISISHVDTVANVISPIAGRDIMDAPAQTPLWLMLAAIWALGVVCSSAFHIYRHKYFVKMVRRWSSPVTDSKVLGILGRLKSELKIKKHIGLCICPIITSPMLVGFYRPAILLPLLQFSDDELSLILKHELIHVKRYDIWCKAFILTATVLHWFNPIVYLMSRAVALQCEISCDALVIQGAEFEQRKQYGEAIICTIKKSEKLQTAFSTNLYGGKQMMKNRISLIMDTKKKKTGVIILCVTLMGIVMTGAIVTAASDSSEPQKSTSSPEVVVATPNNNSDKTSSNHLVELLRNLPGQSTNSIVPQEPNRPSVVVEPPNNNSDKNSAINHLVESLKRQALTESK